MWQPRTVKHSIPSSSADGASLPARLGTEPESLHALQCAVLEAVACGQPLDRIAYLLCQHVEQLVPDIVASVLTVDGEGRLHSLAAPSLPEAFSRLVEGTLIGPSVGSCGAAAYAGRSVGVLSIDTDPGWEAYKALPLAAGLRACWSSPIKGRSGQVVGTFAFYYRVCRAPSALERSIVDASVHLCALAIEHDRVWTELQQTNQRFDLALSNMSQGVCFFDREQRLIVANRRYAEMYNLPLACVGPGTSLMEVIALRVAAGAGPKMTADRYHAWRDTLQHHTTPTDTVAELVNGRVIAIHHQPMPDGGWVATHEDITERRRAEAQVVFMAQHDALTGLPNRIAFRSRLEEALASASRGQDCAVLCLDLDRFKFVNDTFGHAVGDELLRRVADRLRGCVRETDALTRLGGDEFAIFLTDLTQPEVAGELAQRVIQVLSEPFEIGDHGAIVGASVGIAVAPGDGSTADQLLRNADTALYRAKRDERGTYRFFEPEMDARLQARASLERDLRQAVRDQQFELAYQPQYDLGTNAICGFEALLRWRHPTRGTVSPGDFITVAEETGLIVPIGAWVLHQACMDAASWPSPVKVAVNLSAVQFRATSLVEEVEGVLSRSGLSAARLELEITESVLLRDCADTLATLHALRAVGMGICLDDFGTGYSSLSYLRSFPFNKIKIDQSFTMDLPEKEECVAIVRAIVTLGRSLGMATLGEGVETAAQLDQLRKEGCTEAQGYLFSRPIPNDAVHLTLIAAARQSQAGVRSRP